MNDSSLERCPWCGDSEIYVAYHDEEWGVPVHDDRLLFEMLVLEGAQAGLSWLTILKKRQGYRAAFDNFDATRIVRYDGRKVAQLMANTDIVRHELKIAGTIGNARALIGVQKDYGSFDRYIWQFTGGRPIQNTRRSMSDIPSRTPLSDTMSKALKVRGFKFVGSTTCYAFMQAVGMVNDHLVSCHRHKVVAGISQ